MLNNGLPFSIHENTKSILVYLHYAIEPKITDGHSTALSGGSVITITTR